MHLSPIAIYSLRLLWALPNNLGYPASTLSLLLRATHISYIFHTHFIAGIIWKNWGVFSSAGILQLNRPRSIVILSIVGGELALHTPVADRPVCPHKFNVHYWIYRWNSLLLIVFITVWSVKASSFSLFSANNFWTTSIIWRIERQDDHSRDHQGWL